MSWFWVIAMSLYERQLWLCTLSTPLCVCNSVRLTVSVLVELYTVRVIGFRLRCGGWDF